MAADTMALALGFPAIMIVLCVVIATESWVSTRLSQTRKPQMKLAAIPIMIVRRKKTR